MSIDDMKQENSHVEGISTDDASFYSDEVAHQGALILEEERHLGLWESAKLHRRALLICSVSFTAGLAFGYDSIANGASISMPSFFLYFGSVGPKGPYLPSIWTSLWTAMSSLAQTVGAFIIGFVTDRFGRKWPACACAALTIAGTAIQYYAHDRGVLLGGKVVNGFGIGAVMAIATTYASEIAPLKLRGPVQQALVLASVFTLGLGLGIVRIFVPNVHEQAFRNVFAIQWAVGGIAVVAFALAPESPNYLITKGRITQAHKAMGMIYGTNNSIDARLAYLVKMIREEQANKELHSGTYLECFKGVDLRRTLTVVFIYTANNWAGAALLSQSIYFLIIAGLPAIHAFDVSIGGFGLSMVIIIASWFAGDRIRRRDGFAAACCINFAIMLTIGALYYAPGIGPIWGIAVLMNVLISFQTSLFLGMGYPIAAEISSLKLRAKTLSIGVMSQTISSWLTQFTVPYMYNVDSGNLGARTGFVFAALSVLLIIGTWYLVPETTGLTVEEIDRAYAEKVPTRQFQKRIGTGEVGA